MQDNWQPIAGASILRARAELFAQIRHYFEVHDVLEVETPMLSVSAVTDPNIHSLQLSPDNSTARYLHTSPEFPMKRLLCSGLGNIYQIARVFRAGEKGRFHNPEFTMLEWYRLGYDHHELMRELDELVHTVWPENKTLPRSEFISYGAAIERYSGVPLEELDCLKIEHIIRQNGHTPPDEMPDDIDTWLDLLMTHVIAPQFPKNRFTVLFDYPASQAALARIRYDEPPVAERFEMYFGELEVANGFHELTDPIEQQQRFRSEQAKRQKLGLPQVPYDKNLIDALAHGMPDCAGVAVGLDRLLMILCDINSISEVLGFDYDNA